MVGEDDCDACVGNTFYRQPNEMNQKWSVLDDNQRLFYLVDDDIKTWILVFIVFSILCWCSKYS